MQATITNPSHALAYAVLFEMQQAINPALTPHEFENQLRAGLQAKKKLAKEVGAHAAKK